MSITDQARFEAVIPPPVTRAILQVLETGHSRGVTSPQVLRAVRGVVPDASRQMVGGYLHKLADIGFAKVSHQRVPARRVGTVKFGGHSVEYWRITAEGAAFLATGVWPHMPDAGVSITGGVETAFFGPVTIQVSTEGLADVFLALANPHLSEDDRAELVVLARALRGPGEHRPGALRRLGEWLGTESAKAALGAGVQLLLPIVAKALG